MEIQITVENARVPVTVIEATGNIDTYVFDAFMSKAQAALDGGARYVLVDLTRVPYMSSAGLRVLNSMFNKLRMLNGDIPDAEMLKAISDGSYKSPYLKVLNLSQHVKIAFETAGFDMFLETFTDKQKALDSF